MCYVFQVGGEERIHNNAVALYDFRYYQQKQRAIQKIVANIHKGKNTLVFTGTNPFSANSPTRGYESCAINEILRGMVAFPLMSVVFIEEYMTTKTCSFCLERSLKFTAGKGNRHVLCAHCRNANNVLGPWKCSFG